MYRNVGHAGAVWWSLCLLGVLVLAGKSLVVSQRIFISQHGLCLRRGRWFIMSTVSIPLFLGMTFSVYTYQIGDRKERELGMYHVKELVGDARRASDSSPPTSPTRSLIETPSPTQATYFSGAFGLTVATATSFSFICPGNTYISRMEGTVVMVWISSL